MLNIRDHKIHRMYLDYFNNFLTISAFASAYYISEYSAMRVIHLGRRINHGDFIK